MFITGINHKQIGDERFIKIDMVATIEGETNYGSQINKRVQIYACPKCKTLILED
jgi:hypothetical protein